MSSVLTDRSKALLQHLAEHMKMPEASILEIALQRLYNEVFVNQEPDDGPLSDEYRAYLQDSADKYIKNPIVFDQSLFD